MFYCRVDLSLFIVSFLLVSTTLTTPSYASVLTVPWLCRYVYQQALPQPLVCYLGPKVGLK